MSYALAEIATELGCDERTLRRYADLGLLRAEKRGGRGETRLPCREERFLKRHWNLLSGLRRGLRTEHRIRLAVLFGSTATGEDRPDSDVDLLIEHSTGDPEQVVELRRRLQKRIGRPVHLALLDDAEQSSVLLADILAEGRVIVDRDGIWSDLEGRREPSFTVDAIRNAAQSGDPRERNKVAVIERELDVLISYMEELASRGLAEVQRIEARRSIDGNCKFRLVRRGCC